MLSLNDESIKNTAAWEAAGVQTLHFNRAKMVQATKEKPVWVHFGAGNIFRGFIAMLQQRLLNAGKAEQGIIAVETYDEEIIGKIYRPYDNLGLQVIMNADGSFEKTIIGSLANGLVGDSSEAGDWQALQKIFQQPSLQMASFTITEKGYKIKNLQGEYTAEVAEDIAKGPAAPHNVMSKVVALAYTRYQHGQLPIAFVSMDNCSHNGEKLCTSVMDIAHAWAAKGLVEKAFIDYLSNPAKVSFPWSMIDKITPRPADSVRKALQESGIADINPIQTKKHTYIAPFVNTEKPQYLVIEDHFPNGRPALEAAGVMFTDRQTVNRVEKMKVCTCLNPLHTALAVYGCILGYTLIADEMKNPLLKKLVEKIGYDEGMPVVVDPKILKPMDFIKEVIEVRVPNPYIPDTPQRISCDTSQKVGIRFGETIKAYMSRKDLDVKSLEYIPLALAGWCRYLMGVQDNGESFQLSPDPLLDTLTPCLAGIELGKPETADGKLRSILSNEKIFGVDLYAVGLGGKVEGYFAELIAGKGAVQATLQKYLG